MERNEGRKELKKREWVDRWKREMEEEIKEQIEKEKSETNMKKEWNACRKEGTKVTMQEWVTKLRNEESKNRENED